MRILPLWFLFVLCLPAAAQTSNLSGRWFVSTVLYGTPIYYPLNLVQQGDKLTGDFGGDKLQGTLTTNTVQFHAVDDQGGWEDCKATIANGLLTGTMVFVDGSDKEHPQTPAVYCKNGSSHRHQ